MTENWLTKRFLSSSSASCLPTCLPLCVSLSLSLSLSLSVCVSVCLPLYLCLSISPCICVSSAHRDRDASELLIEPSLHLHIEAVHVHQAHHAAHPNALTAYTPRVPSERAPPFRAVFKTRWVDGSVPPHTVG
eukprot:COSAG02_NODE_187_length_30377_cov_3.636271_26_plen_133_part_00